MQNNILPNSAIKTAAPPTTAPTIIPVDERVELLSSAPDVEEAAGIVPPELMLVEELDGIEVFMPCGVDAVAEELEVPVLDRHVAVSPETTVYDCATKESASR